MMTPIKMISAFFLLVICLQQANAQSTEAPKGSMLKINVPALLFKNISLQYELQTAHSNSFAVAVRFRPASSLPLQKQLEDAIDNPKIKVGLASIGNIGLMPEYRFYLSKKGQMRGFYIAPLIGLNYYFGKVPINYSDYVNNVSIEKTGVFSGHTVAITGGFQLGAQWKLDAHWYLDWWILGPNYGFNNGDFKLETPLNDIERISLQFELEKIQQTIPLIKVTPSKPTATGATFKVGGPWAGIRAFGLNLGYRF